MSAKSHRIQKLNKVIRRLKRKEDAQEQWLGKKFYALWRWGIMLQHEFVRDDVKIRAESMAFLTVVSLLPLIAGGFFVFTIFAQFGMVQDALYGFLNNFLSTIPGEHRVFVEEYVLRFKESYLQSITSKSGTLGIFALFILIWVGLQMFNNIDRTLNSIWSADKERRFLEKFRNFMMVSVLAPLVLLSALSLPLVLNKLSSQAAVLGKLSVLSVLLNNILVPLIVLATFAFLYKYIPVRVVKWKSAMIGSACATFLLLIANWGMQIYFRFGTNSAYGKLAIVPLIAFWIYLVWMIVISGAEVSFLVQHAKDLLLEGKNDASMGSAYGLLGVLSCLYRAFKDGKGAVTFEDLQQQSLLPVAGLHNVVEYLILKGYIIETDSHGNSLEGAYVLAKDVSEEPISRLMHEYFETEELTEVATPMSKKWCLSLRTWCDSFKTDTIASFVTKTKSK